MPRARTVLTASLLALAVALSACGRDAAPILDVLAPTTTTDEVGPYAISVVITYSGTIREAVVRWFLAGESAPRPIALVRDGESDRWTAQLPGQRAGAVVRYTIEVEDDEGRVAIAPATAKDGTQPVYELTVTAPPGDGN